MHSVSMLTELLHILVNFDFMYFIMKFNELFSVCSCW